MNKEFNINSMMQDALNGDTDCQITMGNFYLDGRNVQQDYSKAIKWYKMAANTGDSFGSSLVGYVYEKIGNYKDALIWYKKAADLNEPGAQYQLGHMYEHGTGVDEDIDEALKWYKKAAEQDVPEAQAAAGYISSLKAAEHEYKSSSIITETIVSGREVDSKTQSLADYQNNKAEYYKNEAFKWCLKGAKNGNPIAQYELGNILKNNKEYDAAIKCYKRAADQDMEMAMFELGKLYRTGNASVEMDINIAKSWFKKAADLGHEKSISALNDMANTVNSSIKKVNNRNIKESADGVSRKELIEIFENAETIWNDVCNLIQPYHEKINSIDERIASINAKVYQAQNKADHFGSIATMLLLFFFIIPGVLYLIYYIIGKTTLSANASKISSNAQPQIRDLQNRQNKLQEEKEQLLIDISANSGLSESLYFLPDQYKDINAISYMKQCLINMRADTLKEAINLYQDYYDKEQRNEQVLDEQRRHSEMVRLQNEIIRKEISRTADEVQRANLNNIFKK